jgi:uncharacterized Zn-finger protein
VFSPYLIPAIQNGHYIICGLEHTRPSSSRRRSFTMSQNSSPYVSDVDLKASPRQLPSLNPGGVSSTSAPMPSLFSHPPLRLQRKPVVGTILKGITGNAALLTPPLPARRSSPTSLPHLNATLSEPISKEATFPCPYCTASFKKLGHLNRHTLKHTGTRFHCEISGCDKSFTRQDNMRTQYVGASVTVEYR